MVSQTAAFGVDFLDGVEPPVFSFGGMSMAFLGDLPVHMSPAGADPADLIDTKHEKR